MNNPLVIIGAGGHAKVVIDLIECAGRTIRGLTDSDRERTGQTLYGHEILGDDEVLDKMNPATVELVNGLGSIKSTTGRRNVYERHKAKGFRFATLVHPKAIVSTRSMLAEGAQIMAGAILQAGSCIGSNTIINTGAIIDHDCQVADHCHIAPGVTLSGGVRVESGAHIGTGASVRQGICIGALSVVAAGAVVVADVPPGRLVLGVPARDMS